MDGTETKCEKTYKLVLQRYPKSVKVLRAYTRFLSEVKNNPWKADKYSQEADRLELVSPASTHTHTTGWDA